MPRKIKRAGRGHHSRYLILSDLDGTLLNKEGKLDSLTVQTVKRLSQLGHIFCIVTGRPIRNSIDIYTQLGLKTIIANFNGAMLLNPYSKNFREVNLSFNFEILRKILTSKHVLPYINNYCIENHDGTFFKELPEDPQMKERIFTAFHLHSGDEVKVIEKNFRNVRNSDVHSVLLQINNADNLDHLLYEIRQFSKTLITRLWTDWGYGYILEINSVFASKGNALKYLSSYYSIDLNHSFAFGDGDNDTGMLAEASYGFAMQNASTAAKLSASFITENDNNQQGVARELIKFFKLKDVLK